MAAEFRRTRAGLPLVRADGNALPFADGVFDLVTYVQAGHWTDRGRSLPEAWRVLRPGGALAVWWNASDLDREWIAEQHGRIARYCGWRGVRWTCWWRGGLLTSSGQRRLPGLPGSGGRSSVRRMELNRRRFVLLGGGVAAGAAVAGGLLGAAGTATAADAASAAATVGTAGAIGAAGTAVAADPAGAVAAPAADGAAHQVGFDERSLIVDGRRTAVWSGEFHYFRLPDPALWRDVLQKMKACGYNAVCTYVSWNYHSPEPGRYDFTGVRNLGRFLDLAAEAGLFVLVRPGPYINAEVDAGGFPGWLVASAGTARSDDPAYLAHVDEYLTQVNRIIAPRQYTAGGGTVLLYEIENEYAAHLHDGIGADYLGHLYAKARQDGIQVPIYHNDKGRHGYWTPGSFPTGGETGRYLYAFDGYPSPRGTPPDWGWFGSGGSTGGSTASPDTPGFLAEFGGGWFDCWGGAEFAGQGYAGARNSRNDVYERRFYLTNLANGIRLHNVYMTFGGTSWGWLPAPVVYTSYDYGAAFDEARNLTAKVPAMKQIGGLLTALPGFTGAGRGPAVAADDPALKVYHLVEAVGSGPVGAATAGHYYLVRNDTRNPVDANLPVTVPGGGQASVPVHLAGPDAKLLAAGFAVGGRTVNWSSAQPMHLDMVGGEGGRQGLAVLVCRSGEPAEISLAAASAPRVRVLDPGTAGGGAVTSRYDAGAGELRIAVPAVGGLVRVLVGGGGRGGHGGTGGAARPLLLLFADDAATAALWRHAGRSVSGHSVSGHSVSGPSAGGPVLALGPALVRTATVDRAGTTVELTGDTTADGTPLEVWAPPGVRRVRWNGEAVPVRPTASGSLAARRPLPGPGRLELPDLAGAVWRRAPGNPESAAGYDDSAWRVCDLTTSRSVTPVPAGQPVLFADDYGYHYGDVWYRASWTGPVDASAVRLSYQSGTQGMLMAWLDGVPLGSHRQPVPTSAQATTGTWTATARLAVPGGAVSGSGGHTLAVLVRPMAHEEDGGANDAQKRARGLLGLDWTPNAAAPNIRPPQVTWRIRGGLPTADPVRGPLNAGGLGGELAGWHLPGFDDRRWAAVTLPHPEEAQGVSWYRTTFRLAVPGDLDASLGLVLKDDPSRAYRVQIYLNGWNLGQYINDAGPQHTFVLPNGPLRTRGRNTLALAVLTDGSTPAGPPAPALTVLGLHRTGS